MRKSLWIDIWNDRRKEKVIQRQQQGYSFLQSYTMTNFKNTLMELAKGLGMYKGSPTSCYVVIIPPNRKEVIRIRLSDHPSTKDEWVAGEITGLPNRRYSIVIFSNKSMPLQSKQNVKETDWTNYDVEGIPVYEKCFNRIYLKDTIQTLLSILISIYEGKSPSTGSTQITNENKKTTNINKNMKKQTIKLNESQLRNMIKESIKSVLNEGYYGDIDGEGRYGDYGDGDIHLTASDREEDERYTNNFNTLYAKELATLRKEAETKKRGRVSFRKEGITNHYEVSFEWLDLNEVFRIDMYYYEYGKMGSDKEIKYAGTANALINVVTEELKWWDEE